MAHLSENMVKLLNSLVSDGPVAEAEIKGRGKGLAKDTGQALVSRSLADWTDEDGVKTLAVNKNGERIANRIERMGREWVDVDAPKSARSGVTNLDTYEAGRAYRKAHDGRYPEPRILRGAKYEMRGILAHLADLAGEGSDDDETKQENEHISTEAVEAARAAIALLKRDVALVEEKLGKTPMAHVNLETGDRVSVYTVGTHGERVGRVVAVDGDKAMVAVSQSRYRSYSFFTVERSYCVEEWELLDGTNRPPLNDTLTPVKSYRGYDEKVPASWTKLMTPAMAEHASN